jgi:hypothetical protein
MQRLFCWLAWMPLLAWGIGGAADGSQPWLNTRSSLDERADLLNRQLTLDERISMVHGIWARPDRDTAG